MANPSNDHGVQIPAAQGSGRCKAAATPEKHLNRFIRIVVFTERAGNGLGTLAFTWATVVLLGGFSSDLSKPDFGYATVLVFLEAARMFSRNNRLDYQLFFRTRGAFRPLGWNGLIVVVCLSNVLLSMVLLGAPILLSMVLLIGPIMFPGAVRLLKCKPLRRAISLWSPMIAILWMAANIWMSPSESVPYYDYAIPSSGPIFVNSISTKDSAPTKPLMPYLVLVAVVLVVTISRLRFPSIIKLVFWRRVILNLCMSAAILMLVFMLNTRIRYRAIVIEVCAFSTVSFGNLQIPAAVVRVALASKGLTSHNYGINSVHAERNLVPSLRIFYGMVFAQGILYIVACMLEVLSFIPRRSLVRRGEFGCQWGVQSVNLYYKYALEKCMEGGVLAPKKISLIAIAMDSLNSDSSKKQLYGIRMLHIFLQREPTKAQLLSKLAASTKTTARLIRMLDWTSTEDKAIRLFAAKVTVELAKNLRVTTIPGTMQLVSALLDADDEQEETQDQTLNAADNQEETHDPIPNTDNLRETPTPPTRSTQQVGTAEQNSCVLRCWQRISEFWSIPKEEPLTDHDLLPAMGMSIIGSLAGCDQDNCVEISKATDLIPKIVGFTGYRIDTTNTKAQQKVLVKSSLEVLQRLTKIDGEIGITLRYKISEDPFLLNNLAEILEDSSSSQELRELTIDIITKLAMDEGIRQEIGSIQVILTKLMYAFLARDGPSNTHSDCSMPIKAGQALAMLTLESVDNCSAILKEPGVEFIKDLARMLHEDRYRYMAASLLRNLCTHSTAELSDSDLGELSHALPEVLERVMDAERKELEVLVGISSQICSLIPESFMQALEQGPNEARFVEKLVNALNVNMKPSAECPGIRRVVIEQSISMMELNSRYANQFRDCGLMDALSRVEKTPSRAEKYRLFLGNAGLMKHSTHLSSLVVRAKQLMTMH